jgi:hypothetical protein
MGDSHTRLRQSNRLNVPALARAYWPPSRLLISVSRIL